MAIQTTTFKGARYIVKFHDPIEWSANESYEAIEAVQYQAYTYISKQPVPANVPITNTDFWLLWADPNAQMEQLRQLVSQYVDNVEELSGVVGDLSTELGAEIEERKLDIEKAHVFDTVADMKANANLSVGAICHTNGFHSVGDGGAAWYEISASGTANEMDVIACGNLFANLVITEAFVTPEMLGAYGNGTNDDFEFFKQALTYNSIKTNNKTYLINTNESLIISSNSIIDFGEATIKQGSNNIMPLFDTLNQNNIIISNGYICSEHAMGDSNTAHALYIRNSDNVKIEGIRFFNIAGIGVQLRNCNNVNINNCYFKNCHIYGFESSTASNITITNCTMENNGYDQNENAGNYGRGIVFRQTKNASAINCKIIKSSEYGLRFYTDGENTSANEHIVVSDCIIKNSSKHDVYFYNNVTDNALKCKDIIVTNCLIEHDSFENNFVSMVSFSGSNIMFSNNKIKGNASKTDALIFYFYDCDDITVDNNMVIDGGKFAQAGTFPTSDGTNLVITNNKAKLYDIFIDTVDTLRPFEIINNIIEYEGNENIVCINSRTVNNIIKNNIIKNYFRGIQANLTNNLIVQDNDLAKCTTGLYIYTSNSDVYYIIKGNIGVAYPSIFINMDTSNNLANFSTKKVIHNDLPTSVDIYWHVGDIFINRNSSTIDSYKVKICTKAGAGNNSTWADI